MCDSTRAAPTLFAGQSLRTTDLIKLLLESEVAELIEPQVHKQRNPTMQFGVGLYKGSLCLLGTLDRRWIGYTPVSSHRLAGPDRARFRGCLIADRENK